jgi:hypothetical protein
LDLVKLLLVYRLVTRRYSIYHIVRYDVCALVLLLLYDCRLLWLINRHL